MSHLPTRNAASFTARLSALMLVAGALAPAAFAEDAKPAPECEQAQDADAAKLRKQATTKATTKATAQSQAKATAQACKPEPAPAAAARPKPANPCAPAPRKKKARNPCA